MAQDRLEGFGAYTVAMYVDDDGDVVATVDELLGCVAHGETVGEALETLADVKRLWIEVSLENKLDVPPPRRGGERPASDGAKKA